jgi:arylformamidase
MKIYDITAPISEDMPIYPGDLKVRVEPVSRMSEGGSSNVSQLCIGTHAGTHVDPTFHMMADGWTIDKTPLESLVGPCFVCDMPDLDTITASDLESAAIPEGIERIVFKTKNAGMLNEADFRMDFAYLEPDAAYWLAERRIKLVGIDYLSIEKLHSRTHAVHLSLMGAGIVIVEGLNLEDVPGGIYTLVCLPLKIIGGDGSPARAILIDGSL